MNLRALFPIASSRSFFAFAAALIVILFSYSYFLYRSWATDIETALKAASLQVVDEQIGIIRQAMTGLANDLCFLSQQNELSAFLNTNDPIWLDRMSREYATLSAISRRYDQVRFIDQSGMERARVNYAELNAAVVAKSELQNKSDRYYFSKTMSQPSGALFLSPLDLNIERGEIELPHKPMLRVATKVGSVENDRTGMVILNYNASNFLDAFDAIYSPLIVDESMFHINFNLVSSTELAHPMLLNSDGYALYSKMPNLKPWSFMFEDEHAANLGSQMPEAWSAIQKQDSGNLHTASGYIAYKKVYLGDVLADCRGPLGHVIFADTELNDRHWIAIAHTPARSLSALHAATLRASLITFLMLSIALGTITFLVKKYRDLQKSSLHELTRMAATDHLTGLANRAAFQGFLTDLQERQASDTPAANDAGALLYIDLDHFKRINDEHGHDAGDEALISVAKVLTETVRKEDMVARLGGDEFAVVQPYTRTVEEVLHSAQRILERLTNTTVKGETIECSIGFTIIKKAEPLETALKRADTAMYKAKRSHNASIASQTLDQGLHLW